MKLSARNQLRGLISNIKDGAVNGVVSIELGDQVVKADITMESIKELELVAGKPAFAIIKASNVLIVTGKEKIPNISARNQFVGTIGKVTKGAVNGHVVLDLPDGNKITSSITNDAIDSLGLTEGSPAVAVVKATDVMVAVD